jgi:hypothetical protein
MLIDEKLDMILDEIKNIKQDIFKIKKNIKNILLSKNISSSPKHAFIENECNFIIQAKTQLPRKCKNKKINGLPYCHMHIDKLINDNNLLIYDVILKNLSNIALNKKYKTETDNKIIKLYNKLKVKQPTTPKNISETQNISKSKVQEFNIIDGIKFNFEGYLNRIYIYDFDILPTSSDFPIKLILPTYIKILNHTNNYKNKMRITSFYNPMNNYNRVDNNINYSFNLSNIKLDIGDIENFAYSSKFKCLYDVYTGYIYYPTENGIIAVGVIEEQTKKLKNFNKFEIAHLISDCRNYYDPFINKIIWYYKINDSKIAYNKNYFNNDNHDFKKSNNEIFFDNNDDNVALIDIPNDLHTSLDSKYIDDEKTSYDYDFKTYGFKINTPINIYENNINGSILNYIQIHNLFCGLGTFFNTMDIHKSNINLSINISEGGDYNNIDNSKLITFPYEKLFENNLFGDLDNDEIKKNNLIILDLMKKTNNHYLIGSNILGCFIDPITKFVFSIRGCIPVCVGTVRIGNNIVNNYNLMNNIEIKKNIKFYYLTDEEIKTCHLYNYNYIDYVSNKIIYYSYFDINNWRIMYNVNYNKNPRGDLIPFYKLN